MRFSVGDAYARDLATEFYDGLLADRAPKDAAGALAQARRALLAPEVGERLYSPCDHATPILYGETQPGVAPPEGESAEFDPRGNRRHPIAELQASTHAHFVGRTWELAALEREFFGIDAQAKTKPVATIVGIGGMGKTALAAEAADLWGRPFKHVLLYQAKPPNELRIDDWLRDIDLKLREEQECVSRAREPGLVSEGVRFFGGDVFFVTIAAARRPQKAFHIRRGDRSGVACAQKREPWHIAARVVE